MKFKQLIIGSLAGLLFFSVPGFAHGHSSLHHDTYVNGYYRSNGTYVQGHYRSERDGNVYNNLSTKGNVNPYTGQEGTRNPY